MRRSKPTKDFMKKRRRRGARAILGGGQGDAMNTRSGLGSAALAAAVFASLSSASYARADSKGNTRAVIRGTGTDVTIVYETPKAPATEVRASLAEDPVAAALRRKASGEDDAAVIAFLRMNQASLPEIIDSDIVRDFRRAGAGEDVISVLASFTAVDIGETAEGGPVQQLPANTDIPYPGAYPDLVGMGYPFFGSYGGGSFGGGDFGKRFGRHGRRSGFHFGKPSFPRGHSPKGRPFPTHGRRGASRPHRVR